MLGIVAAMIGIVAILGRDAIPDLYAASQRAIDLRSRKTRLRTAQDRFSQGASARGVRVPRGALSLVWKDWVAFARGRAALWLWLAGGAGWGALGFFGAYFLLRTDDATLLAAIGTFTVFIVVAYAPLTASLGLASELSRPLFWLVDTSLSVRLAAWTFARAWRGGIAVGLGPFVVSIVLGRPILTLVSLPLAIVAYWSMQCLGVGLFALFPDPIDARGPMTILRILASGAYVVPAIAFGGIVAFAHGGALGAATTFGLVLGAQGWLALELSAQRFSEYGASLSKLADAQ